MLVCSGDFDPVDTGWWKWSIPAAICPDQTAPGKYWIGDNSAIYQFDSHTPRLELLAGAEQGCKTGGLKEARFSGIGGIVSKRDASRLFVADSINRELKMISLILPSSKPNNFEAVSTLASDKPLTANGKGGAAVSTLCFDASPGVAPETHLFFTARDLFRCEIASGKVTPLQLVNAPAGFKPWGMDCTAAGVIIVVDNKNHCLCAINTRTLVVDRLTGDRNGSADDDELPSTPVSFTHHQTNYCRKLTHHSFISILLQSKAFFVFFFRIYFEKCRLIHSFLFRS